MTHGPFTIVKYRLLEHTADALVEVFGEDLSERFANAAYAMFDQITDITKVNLTGEIKLTLDADNRQQLLVDFLQELLFVHDTENIVFCEFIVKTDGRHLEAIAHGEMFDEEKHSKRSVVKGVTYHRLEFDDKAGSVTVLFDV